MERTPTLNKLLFENEDKLQKP